MEFTNIIRMNKIKIINGNITLFFGITLIFTFISACSPRFYRAHHLDKMSWIEGKWSSTDEGITIAEYWNYKSQQGFSGISFIAAGRDTLFKEQTEIKTGPKGSVLFEAKSGQVYLEESETMQLVKLGNKTFTFRTESDRKTVTYRLRKDQIMQIDIHEFADGEMVKTKYQLEKMK
jgi:hypothetical protein